MTKHSTEELKRQRDVAKSRHIQACIELSVTEKRLHDAMCRDTGFMGATADRNGTRILIHDIEFIGDKPWCLKGFAFKKDGTVGFSERRFHVGEGTKIGVSS